MVTSCEFLHSNPVDFALEGEGPTLQGRPVAKGCQGPSTACTYENWGTAVLAYSFFNTNGVVPDQELLGECSESISDEGSESPYSPSKARKEGAQKELAPATIISLPEPMWHPLQDHSRPHQKGTGNMKYATYIGPKTITWYSSPFRATRQTHGFLWAGALRKVSRRSEGVCTGTFFPICWEQL